MISEFLSFDVKPPLPPPRPVSLGEYSAICLGVRNNNTQELRIDELGPRSSVRFFLDREILQLISGSNKI